MSEQHTSTAGAGAGTDHGAPASDRPEPQADAQTAQKNGAKAQKRPGLVRKAGVIVLLALGLGIWLGVELVLEGYLADRIRAMLDAGNLVLAEETTVTVSVWTSRVEVAGLRLDEVHDDQRRTVFAADAAVADLGLWESLTSFDLVVDELTLAGARASARRYPDGSLPELIQPPLPADRDPPPDIDWVTLYETWEPRLRRLQEWMDDGEQQASPEAEPPARPDPNWDEAVRYQPFPGDYRRTIPRLLIRKLHVDGTDLDLPDQVGSGDASPFDVGSFTISGRMVTPFLDPGEETGLGASLTTAGAGSVELGEYRRTRDDGSLRLTWKPIPLALLAAPEVSGHRLVDYGLTGEADLDLDATWQDGDLAGTVRIALRDPRLDPTAEADAAVHEVAAAVERLRGIQERLRPGEALVLPWHLELAGKTWAPLIVNMDAGGLLEAVRDHLAVMAREATAAGKDKLAEEAGEAVKKTGEAVKDVLSGEMDPEEALKEREKDLEDKTEKAKDFLKNLGR